LGKKGKKRIYQLGTEKHSVRTQTEERKSKSQRGTNRPPAKKKRERQEKLFIGNLRTQRFSTGAEVTHHKGGRELQMNQGKIGCRLGYIV